MSQHDIIQILQDHPYRVFTVAQLVELTDISETAVWRACKKIIAYDGFEATIIPGKRGKRFNSKIVYAYGVRQDGRNNRHNTEHIQSQ